MNKNEEIINIPPDDTQKSDNNNTSNYKLIHPPNHNSHSDSNDINGESHKNGSIHHEDGNIQIMNGDSNKDIYYLSFNIGKLDHQVQFAIVFAGFFLFFSLQSLFQEFLFKREHFPYPSFVVLIQCIVFVILGNLENRTRSAKMGKNEGLLGLLQGADLPPGSRDLILLGLIILLSRICGYSSLLYITFTTKIIIQSSKVIPTLIFGTIFLGKRHTLIEYLMGILMACGLSLFITADAKSDSSSSPMIGIVLMGTQMCCASAKYVFFEGLTKNHGHSGASILFWNNLFSLVLVIPLNIFSGSFLNGVYFTLNDPMVLVSILMQLICSYASNVSIVVLTCISSAHVATVGDAFRKFFSIVMSFIIFMRPVKAFHLIGGAVFFFAVGIQVYLKLKNGKKKEKSSEDSIMM
eukprot:TRINITY_DN2501_c0_g1_i2.p1 TRINITY_DN2501_c0_g1~~TRINITY_DN2501_c0_g1_i2.p1  ORF type:complete len:408 (-),score=85.26 TRINITY_DN2501_c0_g1_i2:22-1245(-)